MSDSPLADALARTNALDPELGRQLGGAFDRLLTAAQAMAWARDRLPLLVAAASDGDRESGDLDPEIQ